jgi:protein TonB
LIDQQHLAFYGTGTGWSLSLIFHGMTVAAAIVLVSALKLPPEQAPFKWEVVMVEPSPPQVQPAAKPPQPLAQPAPNAKSQPVVRTVQTIQTVQRVQEIVHQETRSAPASVQPLTRAAHQIEAAAQSVPATQTVPVAKAIDLGEQVIDVADQAVVRPASQSSDQSAGVISKGTVSEMAVTSSAAPISQTVTTAAHPDVENPRPPTVERQAMVKEIPVAAGPKVSAPVVKEIVANNIPAAKADYGWLAAAIRERVEKLKEKGYPHLARMNRWEGQVTIRVRLKLAGQQAFLADSHVEQSSGYAALDAHALEVVRQIFPLPLKYQIDAFPPILVPISFTLPH